jgi:hypothetical protein
LLKIKRINALKKCLSYLLMKSFSNTVKPVYLKHVDKGFLKTHLLK